MIQPLPGVPIYIQIAETLLERIETGDLAPGDRLPTERELSESLHVTRMTVRQALGMLESQGLLVRKRGVGTFIADPKIERKADRLSPFTKTMQRSGYSPGAKIIALEQRLASRATADRLQTPVGTPVYYCQRLRLSNQEPTMLERFELPAQRFAGFDRFDLETRSVYEVLSSEYGVQISRAEQSLEAVLAGDYESEWLGVAAGAPLMLERRVAYDQAGVPVEYGKDLYRGDRFRFVTEMAPIE